MKKKLSDHDRAMLAALELSRANKIKTIEAARASGLKSQRILSIREEVYRIDRTIAQIRSQGE
jgi:hypothetical protein